MNGKVPLTITGNLTADPELRFTPAGHPVTRFTVASNPRKFNPQTNQWEDGQAVFMRCQVWRDQAENVAESSLRKGMRITVSGVLTQHTWEDAETKQTRSMFVLEADDVSASMRNAQVTVKRIVRDQEAETHTSGAKGGKSQPAKKQHGENPWGKSAAKFGSGTQLDDEPPF